MSAVPGSALGRAHGSATGSSIGSETTKLEPWPGSDSTVIVPPLASTNPFAIASPSPSRPPPSPLVAPAVERLEDPAALGGTDPRPLVDRPARPRAVRCRADVDRYGQPARVAHGVLEQVRERALELGGVGPDRRHVGIDGEPHVATGRRQPLAGGVRRRPRARPSPARLGAPGLEPRQVEQLVDERRELLALLDHRGR